MGVMYKLMKHKHSSLDMKNVLERRGETVAQDKKITAEHILQLCKFLAEKSKRNKQTVKKLKHLEYAKVSALEFDEVVEEMDIDVEVKETALPLIKHNRFESISSSISKTTTNTEITTKTRKTTKTEITTRTATTTALTKQILQPKTVNENSNCSSSSSSSSSSHYPSPDYSISPASPIAATCSMQYHQLQQDSNKKDILQKIRSQIMERKRQRQLAGMQQQLGSAVSVWRPW